MCKSFRCDMGYECSLSCLIFSLHTCIHSVWQTTVMQSCLERLNFWFKICRIPILSQTPPPPPNENCQRCRVWVGIIPPPPTPPSPQKWKVVRLWRLTIRGAQILISPCKWKVIQLDGVLISEESQNTPTPKKGKFLELGGVLISEESQIPPPPPPPPMLQCCIHVQL